MDDQETPKSPFSLVSFSGLNTLTTSYFKKFLFPLFCMLSIPPTILFCNCAEFDAPSMAASVKSSNDDETCDLLYDSVSRPFLLEKRRRMDYRKLMRYYQEDLEQQEKLLKTQKYLLKMWVFFIILLLLFVCVSFCFCCSIWSCLVVSGVSYTPGSFIEEVGGLGKEDYMIPEMTTLLLLGPSGSGKSSLVNKITRVVEDDEFLPDRAQETC